MEAFLVKLLGFFICGTPLLNSGGNDMSSSYNSRQDLKLLYASFQPFQIRALEGFINGSETKLELISCFIFSRTSEGLHYWHNRHVDLRNGKPLSKTARLKLQRMVDGYYRHQRKMGS